MSKAKIYFLLVNAIISMAALNECLSQSCSQANAGPDVAICTGGSSTIGTSAVSGYTYSWTPTTGLSNPNIAQPNASPSMTTTYTVTQTSTTNLITNPGFESGNTGFSSDYTYGTSAPGAYDLIGGITVVSNCTTWPHNGSYMFTAFPPISNPSSLRTWYTTVNVTSSTFYDFTGYFARLSNAAVNFDVILIGNVSGSNRRSFSTTANCGVWDNFKVGWFSGSDTQLTIEIRITANNGNFPFLGLDDLSLVCYSTDVVTVNVVSGAPNVTPIGPITYYNHYEATNSVVLTASTAPSYQWYKNNVAITGATSQSYTINFNGSSTYTDQYKCVSSCGTSNIVSFTYVGCTSNSQYPVTVSSIGQPCVSTFPVSLTQPDAGTGGQYYWQFINPTTCYVLSGVSDVFDKSGSYAPSGCSGGSYGDALFTRSLATNGTEVRMYIGISPNLSCRPGSTSGGTLPAVRTNESAISPNPVNEKVTITSKGKIRQVFIYNSIGVLANTLNGNGKNRIEGNLSRLSPGSYTCRIMTDVGMEILKLVIQR